MNQNSIFDIFLPDWDWTTINITDWNSASVKSSKWPYDSYWVLSEYIQEQPYSSNDERDLILKKLQFLMKKVQSAPLDDDRLAQYAFVDKRNKLHELNTILSGKRWSLTEDGKDVLNDWYADIDGNIVENTGSRYKNQKWNTAKYKRS